MKELVFEKVGDINSTYPYLCIYIKGESNPFMEIAITVEKSLEFTIYQNQKNVILTISQWESILKRAQEFLPKALENEDFS